jgi:hypothetical protein
MGPGSRKATRPYSMASPRAHPRGFADCRFYRITQAAAASCSSSSSFSEWPGGFGYLVGHLATRRLPPVPGWSKQDRIRLKS